MRTEYSFLSASAFMKVPHYEALKALSAYFNKARSTFNFCLCTDKLKLCYKYCFGTEKQ